ncbi:hypothetical protein ACFPA8_11275 [Streptomyces ovatisporus]|uniref:Lipoprotein n=1 Tax=Streptomyces ovatisporus TaxID=1128682 RepID=A0ABV9A653_9ACTN
MVAQGLGRSHAWAAAATLSAVGPLLVLTTGCTDNGTAAASDKPHPSPVEVVRAAPDVLTKYGTSRSRTSMTMASGGTRISVDGKGGFDYRKRLGHLTVRLPEGTSGAQPGERRLVKEIVVPQALYMKNRGAGVPEDKWVRLDTTALPDGNLVTAGATDPVSAAELLRGARGVTYGGRRELDGERVRRYRGTVDLRAAARSAVPHWRDQLAAAAKGFSERTVPFDAYIDGQGRLRKIRHEFTFAGDAQDRPGGAESGGSGGGDVAVSSTTWFHGFGAPVRVEMPDSSDIYAGKIAPF